MAYHLEKTTGDIVINGWENGIADDPYSGIADIRNMNIISIPKESSVNFSTIQNSLSSFSGSVVSADAATEKMTYGSETGVPVVGMAIVFAGGSLPTGITAGTQSASADTNVYWINSIDTNAKTITVRSTPTAGSDVNITATGTGTFSVIVMTQPRHWTSSPSAVYYVIDASGRAWYQNGVSWIFMANLTRANANGNGLVYYQANNGTGYLFVFRNALVDYMPTASIGTWTYAWQTMNTAAGVGNSHHALVGQDNIVYVCDASWINSFYQTAPATPFDPSNASTYTYTSKALALPFIEIAQWLAELGINLLVAGIRNQLYPWDRSSTSFKLPILIGDNFGFQDLSSAQPNTPKMITINTSTFIFMGNRGRIYITNGTNAQLYKKIPDHISGTIEPYYIWGGIGFNKNQLYFGIIATTNGGATNANYGGVWAIDMDSKALRLVNQLSYGSYTGYCTLFIPLTANNVAGSGFYAGWDSGSSTYGIDVTSTPYTNYQSRVDTDNIPIGLFGNPRTPAEVEFKLATPLVSGEGVKVSYRLKSSDAFSVIQKNGADWENTTVGTFSDISDVSWENAQWIQFRVETKSTASSPSYVRLTELRLR